MNQRPTTNYTKCGDVNIAYQTYGEALSILYISLVLYQILNIFEGIRIQPAICKVSENIQGFCCSTGGGVRCPHEHAKGKP